MSVDVGVAIVVERPLDEVAAYAGDLTNLHQWSGRIESAEWRTDPPTRLGSRLLVRTRRLGRERGVLYEIFEWTPGEQIAVRAVADPFQVGVTFTWRPVGDRVSHMSVRIHGEPSGVRRLLAPWMERSIRRALTKDLATLGQLLED